MNEGVLETAKQLEEVLDGKLTKTAGKALILLMAKMIHTISQQAETEEARQVFIDSGIEAITEDMRNVITILSKASNAHAH